MRFPIRVSAILPLLASALLVSSCGPMVRERPIFPPAADVRDLVKEKPKADPSIVDDEEAHARHNADVEAWGIERWLAGGRLCRWYNKMGAKYDFCPPPTEPDE